MTTRRGAPEPRLDLWDFQERIITEAQDALRTSRSLMIAAPTGSGKTVILAEILARTARKNLRGALLVHRQELVKQSCTKIHAQSGAEPGVVWQSRREWDQPITVLAQNSLIGQQIPKELIGIPILIVDEAHHTVAPGWLKTIEQLAPKYLIGFSATPFRQDREPLSPEPFARIIRPVTPHELIQRDVLCPAVIESPILHDGQGRLQPINQASNLETIYFQAIQYALAQGRTRIILYVSSNRESTPSEVIKNTTKTLREHGITTSSIGENTSGSGREGALAQFQDAPGASVLVNYMTLTEGTDLRDIDCVIIGRSTASESTIIQMIGRGLRKHPHKTNCLVLDYTGRQDMDSIIHYWRLDQPKEEGAYTPKQPATVTPKEMEELMADFPKGISPWGTLQVDYSWFRPFPKRPLLALPLWPEPGLPEAYVTVEPDRSGRWRVTTITLQDRGPAPAIRKQAGNLSEEEATTRVRAMLGDKAPLLQRDASWRTSEASDSQKRALNSLRLRHNPDDLQLRLSLSGEVSDAIAQERFTNRVRPEML